MISSAPSATPPRDAPHGAGAGSEKRSLRLGRDFVFSFHSALRALKLYPLENQTAQNALDELVAGAGQLLREDGGLTLRYVGDFCFVNDLRLRVDMSTYATFGSVGRALRRYRIGQIEAGPQIGRAEWTALLSILAMDPPDADPFARATAQLARAGVTHLHLSPEGERPEQDAEEFSHEAARETYTQSVAVARETMLDVRLGRGVSIRRVKRSVQRIVDQVLNNEGSILGMTALRSYDQYTFAHSVNVCIFSIALGKKLGLTKAELYELGIGALMHDIGKTRMPIELTTKDSALAEDEWALVREHPTEGLLTLLELRNLGDVPLRTMLLAYEHHMKIDLSGYPESRRPRTPGLFSRIVAVADGFDAGTARRSYQSEPWLPDQVLREMRDNPKRGFDPLIVKAFIGMTGFYPVGSLVILDSFELAVVVAPPAPDGAHHRPTVRIIYDDLGMPYDPPRTHDLNDEDPGTGLPVRTIIKTVDPEKYGIDVRSYI